MLGRPCCTSIFLQSSAPNTMESRALLFADLGAQGRSFDREPRPLPGWIQLTSRMQPAEGRQVTATEPPDQTAPAGGPGVCLGSELAPV